jgi:hypothetical protein
MAVNYTNLQKTADNLINNFGGTATLIKVTNGVYDPSTGEVTNVPTESTITIVQSKFKTMEIDGTNIQTNDLKLLLKAGSNVEIKDKIKINNVTYNVINVTPTQPGNIKTHYIVQVRK